MKIKEIKRTTTYYITVGGKSVTYELTDGHLYELREGARAILLGARHSGGWQITDLWTGLRLQVFSLAKKDMEARLRELTFYDYESDCEINLVEWYARRMEQTAYYAKYHSKLVEHISQRRGIDPDIRRYIESPTLADAMRR